MRMWSLGKGRDSHETVPVVYRPVQLRETNSGRE